MSALAEWEVLEQVGAGRHAVVHRAVRRDRPGRVVALKRLRAPDGGGVDDLRREAELLSDLAHPAIAVLHDVLVDGEEVVLVLALATGGSLAERLERGPLPWDRVADLGARLADGVAAAHDAGIVHGDLKPSNILFGREDEPRLADFGLARLAGAAHGDVAGTAGYLDPDVARGGVPGPSSDQWSLGVVLWEALVGHRPFDGPDPEAVARAADRGACLPLAGLVPDAPAELVETVERAMARDPRDRFATVRRLQGVLAGLPKPEEPPGATSATAPVTGGVATDAAIARSSASPVGVSGEGGGDRRAGRDGHERPANADPAAAAAAGDSRVGAAREGHAARAAPGRPDAVPDPTTSWGPRPPSPVREPAGPARRWPIRLVVAVVALVPLLVAGWAVHSLVRAGSPAVADAEASRPVGAAGAGAVVPGPSTSTSPSVAPVDGATALPRGWTRRRPPAPCRVGVDDRVATDDPGTADGSTAWADVDGSGCSVPVRVLAPAVGAAPEPGTSAERVLDVGGSGPIAGRWDLGASTGTVVLGDWDGDGDDTPVLVEADGAAWRFGDWADTTAAPAGRHGTDRVAVVTDLRGRDHVVPANALLDHAGPAEHRGARPSPRG